MIPTLIKPEYFCELPRYRKLGTLRQYYESTQYDGRPDFFTGLKPSGEVVPLRERKPCVIYPLPRAAAHQVVRFTFGESRFPTIRIAELTEENAVASERLTKDEAKVVEKFVAEIIDRCDIKPTMRRIMRPGISVGTACAIISVKDGRFAVQSANAEDVQCTFRENDPTREVLSATWSYQFQQAVPDETGHPQSKRFWFRQDITEQAFVEYEPVEVRPGEQIVWRPSKTTPHGFGFCPVAWMRNVEDEDQGDVDGQSLYEGLSDQFDALNLALSQRHRGINFFGVPQPWETGVDEDDGPAASGRPARAAGGGYSPANKKPAYGAVLGSDGRPARPLSPNNSWVYRGEKVRLGLLETTGKAFEASSLHVNDIRSRALEAMSVVLVNVSEIMGKTHQGMMSAKFLELAYEPLLALVDEMRHCWWPKGLRVLLSMMLRIVAVTGGKGLWIPGAAKAAQLLQRFTIATDQGPVWMAPAMTPAWGDYFSPDNDEIAKAVDTAQKADGLVPTEDRARFVLPYFDRHDTAEALAEIEAEEAEDAAAEAQRHADELSKLHTLSRNGDPTKPGQPGPAAGGGTGGGAPGTASDGAPSGGQ